MKKIFFLAVTAVLCAFGTVAAQQFPSVQIEDQEGGMVDTRTLIDGKTPVIISFWSTTCKPCIKELDAIVERLSRSATTAGAVAALEAVSKAEKRIARNITPQLTIEVMLFDIRKAFTCPR